MPRSKHRRKPGTKAVKNPGRNKTPQPSGNALTLYDRAEDAAWHQFKNDYSDAVHQALPPGENDAAEFMAELISDAVFRFEAKVAGLEPTSKGHVFGIFTEGFELHDRTGPPVLQRYTMEEAEATLTQLVTHGFAEVEGDQITVPPRFLRSEENQSAAPSEKSEQPPVGSEGAE